MSSGIDIQVNEIRLRGLADELSAVYNRLSAIKNRLDELHVGIRASWSDMAVEDFSEKYNEGMERIWDFLVAVDSMEEFLIEAAEGYTAADRQVELL